MNEHSTPLALWIMFAALLLVGCASKCGLPPADRPPPSVHDLAAAVDEHLQDGSLNFANCKAPFWISVPSEPWDQFLRPGWVVHDKGPGARDTGCAWVCYVDVSPVASQPRGWHTLLFVFRDGSLQSVIDTMSPVGAPGEARRAGAGGGATMDFVGGAAGLALDVLLAF